MRTDQEKTIQALEVARDSADTEGAHHLKWVIDQMVRILTDCPTVTRTFLDHRQRPYDGQVLGESAEYVYFRQAIMLTGDEWDEGIAP